MSKHLLRLNNGGWALSPAFDINPVENGLGLKLNISLTDNALLPEIALEVAKEFRVTPGRRIKLRKYSILNSGNFFRFYFNSHFLTFSIL